MAPTLRRPALRSMQARVWGRPDSLLQAPGSSLHSITILRGPPGRAVAGQMIGRSARARPSTYSHWIDLPELTTRCRNACTNNCGRLPGTGTARSSLRGPSALRVLAEGGQAAEPHPERWRRPRTRRPPTPALPGSTFRRTRYGSRLGRRCSTGRPAQFSAEGQSWRRWKESWGPTRAKWWRGHGDAAGAKRADSGWGSVERWARRCAYQQVRRCGAGSWPPGTNSGAGSSTAEMRTST